MEEGTFDMLLSPKLALRSTPSGSREITEDIYSAAYDGCLLYLESHLEEVARLGFDAGELVRQREAAAAWVAGIRTII
jgi:hypothetical protein